MRKLESLLSNQDLMVDNADNLHLFSNNSCALAGAINFSDSSILVRAMLQVQQHRGEKSVGIVSAEKDRLYAIREMGRVDEIFPVSDINRIQQRLPGLIAIGHNRYATTGYSDYPSNIQPFIFNESKFGNFVFAHNGQLVDNKGIKEKLLRNGAIFQSRSDSELLAQMITHSRCDNIIDAIVNEVSKIPCSYSVLIETSDKILGFRDGFGVRPLSIAKMNGGYLIASETAAFRIFPEAEFIRHVEPGELVIFDKNTIKSGKDFESIKFMERKKHFNCVFEQIYFQDPRSETNNYMHEDFRQKCGALVYYENKDFFDVLHRENGLNLAVVPILDSGKQGAIGFSRASGIPYKEYFMRRHNAPHSSGRSYTADNQNSREIIANMKLDLRTEKVRDKVIITVDDSNVRGTTARNNNRRLRNAGVKEVYNIFLSPVITSPCYLGMDHQNVDELIGFRLKNLDDIAKETEADKVIHISLEGLNSVVADTYNVGICSGCFGGKYPVKLIQ
ncbi:MAG: amidophosphoribosyltransferase [Candidatus Woesearchaeota archaeon]